MKSHKRIFYVVYAADDFVQSTLDAIRFIADPNEKTRAHVTIKGPYSKARTFRKARHLAEGSEVSVTGVDVFRSSKQNTVFLSIDSPVLKKLFDKPDSPDARPHLTIYDGAALAIADELHQVLQECNIAFSFTSSTLEPLQTKKGQSSLELRVAYDEALVEEVTGQRVEADEVPKLSNDVRVRLIAQLCAALSARQNRVSVHTVQHCATDNSIRLPH